MHNIAIYNKDCIDEEKKITDNSVNLAIFDPPFGLGETGFNKHYKRNAKFVLNGYKEAPDKYEQWTHAWLMEARRVLHPDGSMYVFMGHSNLRYLLNCTHMLGFHEINHIIWKYNFGVNTKKKFVTSHYHVLYYSKSKKSKKSKPVFNLNCRFGSHEKRKESGKSRSLLHEDLEDIFVINRDYSPGKKKNQNKLPNELIKKLILYSSNEDDVVCDFFMGNFTTAYVALELGRKVCGFEINRNAYNYHMPKVSAVKFGCALKELRKVENILPPNQGKKVTQEEASSICRDYLEMANTSKQKRKISEELQVKYGRGRFSIKNILDKYLDKAKI